MRQRNETRQREQAEEQRRAAAASECQQVPAADVSVDAPPPRDEVTCEGGIYQVVRARNPTSEWVVCRYCSSVTGNCAGTGIGPNGWYNRPTGERDHSGVTYPICHPRGRGTVEPACFVVPPPDAWGQQPSRERCFNQVHWTGPVPQRPVR
jgi:hypothetical protein